MNVYGLTSVKLKIV